MIDYSLKIAQLKQIIQIVNHSAQIIEQEWINASSEPFTKIEGKFELVSPTMFEAQRTIIAATGSIHELVSEPHRRLEEVAGQYWTSATLLVAVEHRIADLLKGHDDGGVHAKELGDKVGIDHSKLERILRTLTSEHIFRESHSSLTNFSGGPAFSSANHLPAFLVGPNGASEKVFETAFNAATGVHIPYMDWVHQRIPKGMGRYNAPGYDPVQTDALIESSMPRPEAAFFRETMRSTGKISGSGLIYDYPWADFGKATVVDVGGNIGAMCLGLAALYPDLNFIIQDLVEPLKAAPPLWREVNKAAVDSDRVKFQVHDFFTEQPVKNAEIYLYRFIMHDWSDEYCIKILSRNAAAMGPSSRLLLCDQVMVPGCGSPDTVSPPKPLPANYGTANRFMNHMDMIMMGFFNAFERTPEQFHSIVRRSGLEIIKIWDCRSIVSIIECRLA